MTYIIDATSMLTYLATLIVSFLGVYAGAILGFISPEELKPGKNYLVGLQNTILIFIILLCLYAYGAPVIMLVALGIVLGVTFYQLSKQTVINQISFFLLGIAFYLSTKTTDLFIAVASLIFLYGLPLGSLYVLRHESEEKSVISSDILLKYFFFIIVGILTHFVASKFMG